MAQKANNKMNISYTIKAIDRFTQTHQRLERQLDSLERQLNRIGANTPTVNVNVNTQAANQNVNRLQRNIAALPAWKRIVIWVEEQGDMDRLATKLRNIDEIMLQMGQGLIWMLLPALGPMLGIAAGGAGALAAQLVGAGAAMGAFAMVAVPAINYLKEVNGSVKRGSKEWYNLSTATRSTLVAVDQLQVTWDTMQKKFREPTLEVFTLALWGANTALKMFQPTIQGSIEAMKNLATSFNESLGSADVKAIFEWFGNTAGGYFESLMKTIGNFFVGFMNMMVAFDPLAQDFADGFLNMSTRFREWSSTLEQNKAFQDFLNYARENGPLFLSFLGSLINFLVQLGIAMAPIGKYVMEMTTKFLKWADAGLENNEMIGHAIAAFLLFRASLSVLGPVFVMLIRTIATVITWGTRLWKVVSKLITIFTRVMPIIMRVGMTLLRFATGPVGVVIAIVAMLAYMIYKNWDAIWAKTKEIFGKVKDFFVGKWKEIKDYLKNTDLKTIGKDIMNGLIKGLQMVNPMTAVTKIAGKIKDGFTKFFDINSPSRVMNKDVGRWITLGVLDGMLAMAGKAEREATIVANAIKRPFDSMTKDYRFTTGVTTARGSYEAARASQYQSVAQQPATAEAGGGTGGMQYAVINIAGHEAKATIQYITREQERDKARDGRFK